jgi:hypothetical protein
MLAARPLVREQSVGCIRLSLFLVEEFPRFEIPLLYDFVMG